MWLEEGAHVLGVHLPPGATEQFGRYIEEVLRWRAAMNLTGFKTARSVLHEGILDSLACLPALPLGPVRAVDIGSGAGFPGVPLRIARPDIALTLVEARRRRHSFLAHLCRILGITDVQCLHGRAEVLAGRLGLRATFDIAFARAVRRVEEAAALAGELLRPGGLFVSQQGVVGGNAPPHLEGYGRAETFIFTVRRRKGAVVAYPRLA